MSSQSFQTFNSDEFTGDTRDVSQHSESFVIVRLFRTFCPQTPFGQVGTGTPGVSAHWSAASVMLRSLLNTSDIFPLHFPEFIS